MLKKFKDWWSKTPYGEEREYLEEQNEYENVYEEYKYETTLTRDLKVIADLIGRNFPKDMVTDFYCFKGVSKISFYTKDMSEDEVRKKVELKSLRVDCYWEFINTTKWEADYKEYMKIYQSKRVNYANTIRELLGVVKNNFDNQDYFYTFCKYEDSIHIVANTLKDEYKNNNGEISEEVFQKAKAIIQKCGVAIMKRYRELENIEKLQKEAVSKSLINRLDDEIDFIDKYIEVQ